MIFANVNDIAIPEGNVIKIQETNGGRVLWEKKKTINPSWTTINVVPQSGLGDYITSIGPNPNNAKLFRTCLAGNSSGSYICGNPQIILMASGAYNVLFNDYPMPVRDADILAISDDGRLICTRDRNSNSCFIDIIDDYGNITVSKNVNPPLNDAEIYITLSPERNEYLISGLASGTFTLPYSFTSSTAITLSSFNLRRSVWASGLNRYYAVTGLDRYVYSSDDGYTWQQVQAFNSDNVLGVDFLAKKNMLCAIGASHKLALSKNSISWNEVEMPFSGALDYSYSLDHDLFCVLTHNRAFLSFNLIKWHELVYPDNITFSAPKIFHAKDGIFLIHDYKGKDIYVLSAIKGLSS